MTNCSACGAEARYKLSWLPLKADLCGECFEVFQDLDPLYHDEVEQMKRDMLAKFNDSLIDKIRARRSLPT